LKANIHSPKRLAFLEFGELVVGSINFFSGMAFSSKVTKEKHLTFSPRMIYIFERVFE
jgi:hypothetical protein